MTIAFERTPDDLVHFTKYHMRNSAAMRRNRRLQMVIGSGAVAVIVAYVFRNEGLIVITPAVLFGCLSSVLFNKLYVSWCLNRVLRALQAEGHQKGLVGRHEIELTTTGILERGPLNESRTAWPAIERFMTEARSLWAASKLAAAS